MAAGNQTHTSRALKYGSNAILATLLFLVVLGTLNYFAARSQIRLDLTNGKQFTLSDTTKKLLSGLNDTVNVNVYATAKGTDPSWARQRTDLNELLDEYHTRSNGRVRYRMIDPTDDPEAKKSAQEAGIPQVAMQKRSSTEVGVKVGYFGIQVKHGAKTEVIQVVEPNTPLEYQLTRAIAKAAQAKAPAVGVVVPGGNPYMGDQGMYSNVSQLLQSEGFDVKPLEAAGLKEIKDIDMLVIVEPGELSEEALFRIDQFVMKGGKLFVAAAGVEVNGRTGQATGKAPNINSLLEFYGVRINEDLVEEWGKGRAVPQPVMTRSRGLVYAPNPLAMLVTDMAKSSPITKDLRLLLWPFASSVSKTEHATSGSVLSLAQTSDMAKHQEKTFSTNIEQMPTPAPGEKLQQFDLVMQANGPFGSRYSVYKDPVVITKENGTTETVAASQILTTSTAEARVIACGSALAFMNKILAESGSEVDNLRLLDNAVDSFTRGGQMIELRGKKTTISLLKPKITQKESTVAQAIAIALVPALLILFGIAKASLNRIRRRRYREIYGSDTNGQD